MKLDRREFIAGLLAAPVVAAVPGAMGTIIRPEGLSTTGLVARMRASQEILNSAWRQAVEQIVIFVPPTVYEDLKAVGLGDPASAALDLRYRPLSVRFGGLGAGLSGALDPLPIVRRSRLSPYGCNLRPVMSYDRGLRGILSR